MNRAEVLRILAEHREDLRSFGVRSLSIFGSVARDEARPDSDVDVLVEFERPVGYFTVFDVENFLERVLGRDVDVFTPGSLHDEIRDMVLRDAIRAA